MNINGSNRQHRGFGTELKQLANDAEELREKNAPLESENERPLRTTLRENETTLIEIARLHSGLDQINANC